MGRKFGLFSSKERWLGGVGSSCVENVEVFLRDNPACEGESRGVCVMFHPWGGLMRYDRRRVHPSVSKASPNGFSFHAVVTDGEQLSADAVITDPSTRKKRWGTRFGEYMDGMWTGKEDVPIGHVTVPEREFLNHIDEIGGARNFDHTKLPKRYRRGRST